MMTGSPDQGPAPAPPSGTRTWLGEPLSPSPVGNRQTGPLLVTALAWAAFVLLLPGINFLLDLAVVAILIGGAVLLTALWIAARRREWDDPGIAARVAFALVPAIVVLTIGLSVLDWQTGYRDTVRWQLSRGAFESVAADLALDDPDAVAFHEQGRLVGLVWVDSIDVYGDDVLFNLPGYLDHAVIARDGDGSVHAMLEDGRRLADGWYRYWYHF